MPSGLMSHAHSCSGLGVVEHVSVSLVPKQVHDARVCVLIVYLLKNHVPVCIPSVCVQHAFDYQLPTA